MRVCLRCWDMWVFYPLLSPFPAAGVLLTVFWCYSRALTQPGVIWFFVMSNNVEEGQSVNAAGLLSWVITIMVVASVPLFFIDACFRFLWPLLDPQVCLSQLVHLFPSRSLVFPHHQHPCMTFCTKGKISPPNMSLYPVSVSILLYVPLLLPLLIHPHLATVTMLTELICAPVNICSSASILLASI